ncbi:uncharacterized protein LOC130700078 [Daphnia carinata]|uniref:uncharacterized protein LOC130700078 n=1 Tax=Daphnia carinata TaxID=120202 RepID=UPI00257DB447|nr:uncharacterized protein LOC130700078 [Daphnia carinata]
MRCTYVPLSFVLCAVAIVGCWPLHPLEPSTDELSVPISSFQSPLEELIMGGFLSRPGRREETSPRLKSEAEAKPDQNEIEVNRHKNEIAESESSSDELTVGIDPIEECELPECVDLVRNPSDKMPADEISSAVYVDPVPELPSHPAPEDEVVEVDIEEQDNSRDMRSSPHDVIQESSFNDNENIVDVSHEQPHPDSSLHKVDSTDFPSKEEEVTVEEPQYERDVRSPSIFPFSLPQHVLVDEDADVIVDVISEESRPAFDPSIHLMAEPVIFHPQPLPVEDVIELDLDMDDEMMKRKKRTLQNPNNIHSELKESQPGLDDEDLIDLNVDTYKRKKRARKIPRHQTVLDNPI